MHQMFDKMAQSLRLSPNYNRGNLTWNNHGTGGQGENWDGSTTPFTSDIFSNLGNHLANKTKDLTNKQLWALLKPDGNDLVSQGLGLLSWRWSEGRGFRSAVTALPL